MVEVVPHTFTPLESLSQRIWRHVANDGIDFRTIIHGAQQMGDLVLSTSGGTLKLAGQVENYMGATNVTMAEYSLSPSSVVRKLIPTKIRVYQFPEYAQLKTFVTSPEELIPTKDFLKSRFIEGHYSPIASFTGPTFLITSQCLPNNGFYTQETDLVVQFQETNPPGQRRGAIAIRKDGILELWDDQTKWKNIDAGLKNYSTVAGTPHYLLGTDIDDNSPKNTFAERNKLSYLMEYTDAHGSRRFCYIISERMTTREVILDVCSLHSQLNGGIFEMASELEYSDASIIMRGKGPKEIDYIEFGSGFTLARCHWVVIDPQ